MDANTGVDNSNLINIKTISGIDILGFPKIVRGLVVSNVQLEAGVFLGDATTIDLQDVIIVSLKSNLSYFAVGGVPGYVGFPFLFDLDGAYFINKALFSSHRQAVMANSTNNYAVFPKRYHGIILLIKVDSLPNYLSSGKCKNLLQTMEQSGFFTVEPNDEERAARFILKCQDEILKATEDRVDSKLVAEKYNRLIIRQLYDYLEKSVHAERVDDDSSSPEKILDRCLRHIFQQKGLPVSLQRLSSAVFASKRSIQYAFSKHLGFSQAEFSRIVRLNAIRNDLLSIKGESVPTSEILRNYQILNAGRFRHEYFAFFGEYPRDTASIKP